MSKLPSRSRKATASSVLMDDVDYIVVDVETTGLSPNTGDRVCEIGAVKLRGNAVIESFGSLINPERPISAGAYAVNGISPEMVAEAPRFTDVAQQLWNMMEHSVLVAYNAPFDKGFLASEFRLAGFPALGHATVDALALARQLLPGLGKYPQQHVARVMGIPFPVQHRALEDATVTAQLFIMFSLMLKAYDCHDIQDFGRKDLTALLMKKRQELVDDAVTNKRNLWIKYLSPTNAEITERVISPKERVTTSPGGRNEIYVIAYCHSAQGERSFRIDRILDVRILSSSLQ